MERSRKCSSDCNCNVNRSNMSKTILILTLTRTLTPTLIVTPLQEETPTDDKSEEVRMLRQQLDVLQETKARASIGLGLGLGLGVMLDGVQVSSPL